MPNSFFSFPYFPLALALSVPRAGAAAPAPLGAAPGRACAGSPFVYPGGISSAEDGTSVRCRLVTRIVVVLDITLPFWSVLVWRATVSTGMPRYIFACAARIFAA